MSDAYSSGTGMTFGQLGKIDMSKYSDFFNQINNPATTVANNQLDPSVVNGMIDTPALPGTGLEAGGTSMLGNYVPDYLTKTGAASGATPDNTKYTEPTEPPAQETSVFDINDKGFSKFGSTMSGIGQGVQAVTGLGSLYLANKNYQLQKDQANYLKGRDAQNDARLAVFAKNVGGTY